MLSCYHDYMYSCIGPRFNRCIGPRVNRFVLVIRSKGDAAGELPAVLLRVLWRTIDVSSTTDGANEDKNKTMKLDGPRVATLALSPNSQEETKETRATTSVASKEKTRRGGSGSG